MPLFKRSGNILEKIDYVGLNKEREIQNLFENNLQEMLGITFLASEFVTENGRIDTLAIDGDGNPVILEYKLKKSEHALTQGLFYLDWLLRHKGDFQMLVNNVLGDKNSVFWDSPKLIIVAENFSRYDVHAVDVIQRDISLYRYYMYDNGLLYLERINTNLSTRTEYPLPKLIKTPKIEVSENSLLSLTEEEKENKLLANGSIEVRDMYFELKEKILELNDEIKYYCTNKYISYKLTLNFIEIHIQKNRIVCQVKPPNREHKIKGRVVTDTWTLSYRVDFNELTQLDDIIDIVSDSLEQVM